MGPLAGGEGDEAPGSPTRVRDLGARAGPGLKRGEPGGLNLGESNGKGHLRQGKFCFTDIGAVVGPARSAQ